MTAVASPPNFANNNRPVWGLNSTQTLNSMNSDNIRGVLMPRKTIARTNSASSVSSNPSVSSTSSAVSSTNGQTNGGAVQPTAGDLGGWPNAASRKRPQGKGQSNGARSENGTELGRMSNSRSPMTNGSNGALPMSPSLTTQPTGQMAAQRPLTEPMPAVQPVLYLLSLNGCFDRKKLLVPIYPGTLRVGRQTNNKTAPTATNGFFDSRVLSRQHAEIWADNQGKIWIRDVKSSNGTFVNGTRLSPENRESEPHELQTSDHLELGIDIVSEDQSSVVHHKVAAKVEHAGFPSPSNNLLDVDFGVDSNSGGVMMPQAGGILLRRSGNVASNGTDGRWAGAAAQQQVMSMQQANGMAFNNRTFMNAHTSAELIVKKLKNEMRNARLQGQDLSRTNKFFDALLSNEDIKNQGNAEVLEQPKSNAMNGNSHSFRSDPKARFSDPPAPPPQQPLPEKPDVARRQGETPSLKRATTERPKAGSTQFTASPVWQDNLSQIIQLTEALNNAKSEIDNQHAKMRDLEELLLQERNARAAAEQHAKQLEDEFQLHMNGDATTGIQDKTLEEAFEPTAEHLVKKAQEEDASSSTEAKKNQIDILQSQVDFMLSELREAREQAIAFKKQAEQATSDRDADRKTLAEMVRQIRQRDREAAVLKAAAPKTSTRSRSRTRSRSNGRERCATVTARDPSRGRTGPNRGESILDGILEDLDALSRANTITPTPRSPSKQFIAGSDLILTDMLPYASMLGVVLIGIGLMAYINGWGPQLRLIDR